MFSNGENEAYVTQQLENYLNNEKITKYNLLYRSKTGGNINEIL
jgi:hypothetical protein